MAGVLIAMLLLTFQAAAPASVCDAAASKAKACADVDYDAPVLIQGAVDHVDWVAPNAIVFVRAEKIIGDQPPGGLWRLRGPSPNAMIRSGLTRDSLRAGAKVIVKAYRVKDRDCDGGCRAQIHDLTFQCHAWVGMSSGTGPKPPTCSDIEQALPRGWAFE